MQTYGNMHWCDDELQYLNVVNRMNVFHAIFNNVTHLKHERNYSIKYHTLATQTCVIYEMILLIFHYVESYVFQALVSTNG